MPRLNSDLFIDRTCELLSTHCGGDVTLSTILDACNAQKGSLYHFFPGGKDELLAAAVENQANCAAAHIQRCLENSSTAAEAIQQHLEHISDLMDRPDSPVGMPFLALAATIGATNESARLACEDGIARIQSLYVKQLVKDGFTRKEAKNLAAFSVLAVDGAFLLSRSRGNTQPLKLAALNLGRMFVS